MGAAGGTAVACAHLYRGCVGLGSGGALDFFKPGLHAVHDEPLFHVAAGPPLPSQVFYTYMYTYACCSPRGKVFSEFCFVK